MMFDPETKNTTIYYSVKPVITGLIFAPCLVWLVFAAKQSKIVEIVFASALTVFTFVLFFVSLVNLSFVLFCKSDYAKYQ